MAQASSQRNTLRRVRSTVGGPITSTVLVVGAALILLGAVLQTGVWAGMLGIIGGLLVLVSVTARLLIWLYRKA